MQRYEVTFYINVDEEAHATFDEATEPIGQPVEDWYDTDLFRAIEECVVELDHDRITVTKIEG